MCQRNHRYLRALAQVVDADAYLTLSENESDGAEQNDAARTRALATARGGQLDGSAGRDKWGWRVGRNFKIGKKQASIYMNLARETKKFPAGNFPSLSDFVRQTSLSDSIEKRR